MTFGASFKTVWERESNVLVSKLRIYGGLIPIGRAQENLYAFELHRLGLKRQAKSPRLQFAYKGTPITIDRFHHTFTGDELMINGRFQDTGSQDSGKHTLQETVAMIDSEFLVVAEPSQLPRRVNLYRIENFDEFTEADTNLALELKALLFSAWNGPAGN